jgi:NAD(P)-dependent dehydrogenase (short-subunit alcohol dehydrogenase family)
MPFAGKVAVVTGAAGDVGRAVTRALRARGTEVLAVDGADQAEALAALGAELPGIETFVGDVTRSIDVAAYVAHARHRFGGIDLFFNNTDVEGPVHELPDYPEEVFDVVVGANLRAAFLGLKHVLPHLSEGGAIVNMASDLAVTGAPGLGGYVASKHGVLGLTRVAALECERRRIQVNAICPTRVREVVLDGESPSPVPFGDGSADGFRTPEEVADLVIFLLSDGGRLHHRPEAHVIQPLPLPATPTRNGATPP